MLDVRAVFDAGALNPLMALGRPAWESLRTWLVQLLTDEAERDVVEPHLVPVGEVRAAAAFGVADYVDFYCSLQHATNVGRMFRPDAEPLHAELAAPAGRLPRPLRHGGRLRDRRCAGPGASAAARRGGTPPYGPSRSGWTSRPSSASSWARRARSASGSRPAPSPTTSSASRLLNDWSARDIQAWEYVPLGSVPRQVLRHLGLGLGHAAGGARGRPGRLPGQDPAPLEYLQVEEPAGYDMDVEVLLNGEVVSRPPYAAMYWSPAQMLAHLTVNGASLRTGDLFASGTVSGDARDQRGSFLELSWGGSEPFAAGTDRTFLRTATR